MHDASKFTFTAWRSGEQSSMRALSLNSSSWQHAPANAHLGGTARRTGSSSSSGRTIPTHLECSRYINVYWKGQSRMFSAALVSVTGGLLPA